MFKNSTVPNDPKKEKKRSFTFFDRLDMRSIHDKTKTRPLSRLAAIDYLGPYHQLCT